GTHEASAGSRWAIRPSSSVERARDEPRGEVARVAGRGARGARRGARGAGRGVRGAERRDRLERAGSPHGSRAQSTAGGVRTRAQKKTVRTAQGAGDAHRRELVCALGAEDASP